MSSVPSVPEKEKIRRPIARSSDTSTLSHHRGPRTSDKMPTWGDTPSFSFDYYDHGTDRDSKRSQKQREGKLLLSNETKATSHFNFYDSWRSIFKKSRTNGEPFTLRNLEGAHCSPPVTPILDVSRDSSIKDNTVVPIPPSSSTISSQDIKIKKTIDSLSLDSKSQVSTNYGEKRMDRPRRIVFQDEVEQLRKTKERVTKTIHFSDKGSDNGALNYSIPTGHRPKPHVVPDYVLKYPGIRNAEERENYKAVFNDQYAEYKELYGEVRTALLKFKELDTMMNKLTSGPQSRKAPERIKTIMQVYDKKKNDPAFMEKRERCVYLKNKLAHIKKQIQAYENQEGSVYF